MTGGPWWVAAAGALASAGLLLALAAKWKLPWRPSLAGILLAAASVALLFLWIEARFLSQANGWMLAAALLGQIAATAALAVGLALAAFWRDPERVPPDDPQAILSPADGQVLYVTTVEAGSAPLVSKQGRAYRLAELLMADGSAMAAAPARAELRTTNLGGDLWQQGAHVIGIEMNLLNVHVNRCPIAGQVRLVERTAGRFISLRRTEAPFVNERLTTVIAGPELTVAVVQVASRLVRRIEGYLAPGQVVGRGERLGRIRFGSLVAVVLPRRPDVRIVVQPGDATLAGRSVVARCETPPRAEDGRRGEATGGRGEV